MSSDSGCSGLNPKRAGNRSRLRFSNYTMPVRMHVSVVKERLLMGKPGETILSWTEPRLVRETREALEREELSWVRRSLPGLLVALIFLTKAGFRLGGRVGWLLLAVLVILVAAGYNLLHP